MVIDTDRLESDAAYREELQHRFVSDHFFAAPILGFNGFIRELHQPAVDIHFAWNNKLPLDEQDPIHQRLHIDPRHTFKSTLAAVDRVMGICAFPREMTTLIETATQPLGKAMVLQGAKFFYSGRSSGVLRRIFPELELMKLPSDNEGWNTPSHEDDTGLDKSMMFTSPKSTQSGWHPWRIDADDMVDTINSGIDATEEVRQSVINTYNTNRNCLRIGGYLKLIGTRYHPYELYGKVIQEMDPSEWKVCIRAALTVKDGTRLVPGEFPAEEDVILHFPQLIPYKKLRDLFKDYESFMCQMMNDPKGGSVPRFDEKQYNAAQIDPARIPVLGETVICIRLPFGGKKFTVDYAEGACARIVKDKVYIVDSWRGIYSPSGLAERIVKWMKQYEAEALLMEAFPGTEYMAAHIRNEGQRKNLSVRIQWLEYEEDDNRRAARIEHCEPMIKAGRLMFSNGCKADQNMRKQFIHYGLVVENGIADCVSRLAERIPLSVLRSQISEHEIEEQNRVREQAQWNEIFRMRGMPVVQESIEQQNQARATILALDRANGGLPSLPGGLDG